MKTLCKNIKLIIAIFYFCKIFVYLFCTILEFFIFINVFREINNIRRVTDETLVNKFHYQNNLTSAQLYALIENQNTITINMTYEEENYFFLNILEFAKFFNSVKSELIKNKKDSEEKARNHHE